MAPIIKSVGIMELSGAPAACKNIVIIMKFYLVYLGCTSAEKVITIGAFSTLA
ncbi:hypothetical protein SDC9_186450 [bioreactor metagenome]|uniref:Uncharacterized protein n=1 Tax=bioreactor metagenome TaxID=1076179 RepID=A0A645HIU2_9ZZZZ